LLHKSSGEVRDNTLVMRLVTPGLRVLLLDTAAQSSYALDGLLADINPAALQADIVAVTGEAGKPAPAALEPLLRVISPALLVVLLTAKKGKAAASPETLASVPFLSRQDEATAGQVLLLNEQGTLTIRNIDGRWNVEP
jgi:hypothetical protein